MFEKNIDFQDLAEKYLKYRGYMLRLPDIIRKYEDGLIELNESVAALAASVSMIKKNMPRERAIEILSAERSGLNTAKVYVETIKDKFTQVKRLSIETKQYIDDAALDNGEPLPSDIPLIPIIAIVSGMGIIISSAEYLATYMQPRINLARKQTGLINAFLKGELSEPEYMRLTRELYRDTQKETAEYERAHPKINLNHALISGGVIFGSYILLSKTKLVDRVIDRIIEKF